MSETLNRFAIPIVLLVFLGIGGAFWFMSRGGAAMTTRAEAEIFTPYHAALSAGRYAEAWALFSSERQREWPLAGFTEHWQKLLAEEGPIQRHEIRGARGSIIDTQLFLRGEMLAITYTVTEQAGRLRLATGVATSRNLQRTRAPW
jgi:hypothetical protein